MKRMTWFIGTAITTAFAVAIGVALHSNDTLPDEPPMANRVPLAVLGDSDSHSYQDALAFPPGSPARGGQHRAHTFQWIEVLARLRESQIDTGAWGRWGTRGVVARARAALGLTARTPQKLDYRYNFAASGATCNDLLSGQHQVRALLRLMQQSPERWRSGVVVIRIGVNSVGNVASLDQLARDANAPAVQTAIADCVASIRTSVSQLRAQQPQLRIVLVGIFDNSHWAPNLKRWQSAHAIAAIAEGLDRFDQPLRELASTTPNTVFFDDRGWFAQHWGSRDAEGKPAYRRWSSAATGEVSNSSGDEPQHAVLADGHAGLVWNTLWAQTLSTLLHDELGIAVTPVSDGEVERFLAEHASPSK